MITSIIDIGTKSIKHIIFENKKQIFYNRDSSIKLGEQIIKTNHIGESEITKALSCIKNSLMINDKQNVQKTIVLGTDVLRKPENSKYFINKLKKETNLDIRIISHKEEAELLGKAFQGLIKGDFAAVNIGGGSTEVAVFKNNSFYSITVPFGVNRIYQGFLEKDYANKDFNNIESWNKVNDFIKSEIDKAFSEYDLDVDILFITGVLLFTLKQQSLVGLKFEKSPVKEHPIKMSIQIYEEYLKRLKKIGVKRLAEQYPDDPDYSHNFAIGQAVYFTVAKKLKVNTVYPSEFQYIHGLIE